LAPGLPVIGEDQFPALTGAKVGAKEQAGHGVRVNVAFETHPGATLNIEDGPVPLIAGSGHRLADSALRQAPEVSAVKPAQPREFTGDPVRVDPATGDAPHIGCLAGDNRRPGKVPEIRVRCRIQDVLPPGPRKHPGDVERRPLERGQHSLDTSPKSGRTVFGPVHLFHTASVHMRQVTSPAVPGSRDITVVAP
jgi:hypothetical protein